MKQDNAELTYEEQQSAGCGEKVPFPEMDEIEWVTVEAPEWFSPALLMSQYGKFTYPEPSKAAFEAVKSIYKNSKDFTVTWELKDKHAYIKAEYAAAKEAEKNGGPIVKIGYRKAGTDREWCIKKDITLIEGLEDQEYTLIKYKINWNKVLAWSYANGVFVECEFSNHAGNTREVLRGLDSLGRFIGDLDGIYRYCRLAPGVEIQDEWLEEVTDDSSTL